MLSYINSNGKTYQVEHSFEVMPYFTAGELACKGTGVIKVDRTLEIHLPVLRHQWAKPLAITSGCRTPKHNTAIGGHPNSFHLTENGKYKTNGTAGVDIAWRTWDHETKLAFIKLAKQLGWNIGVADTFVHVDRGRDYGLDYRKWKY